MTRKKLVHWWRERKSSPQFLTPNLFLLDCPFTHKHWRLRHRCAIPAWIKQYQNLILGNHVSIPISISIFYISEMDTNININSPDFENQYQYRYQYLRLENSITIPIPILKNLQFKTNIGLNTKVLQYSECKNFYIWAIN